MARIRGRPTSSEWADIKPEFIRLYIDHGKTLNAVKKELAERGFIASDRQFKSRIAQWDLGPKKLERPKYHAMYVVLSHRQRIQLSSTFLIRRGGKWQEIKAERIKKEINRKRTIFDPMNLVDSEKLLEKENVMVFMEGDPHLHQIKTALQGHESDHADGGQGGSTLPGFIYSLYSPRLQDSLSWETYDAGSSNINFCNEPRVDSNIVPAAFQTPSLFDEASDLSLIQTLVSSSSCMDPSSDHTQSLESQGLEHYSNLDFDNQERLAARWIVPYLRSLLSRNANGMEVDWQARHDAKIAFEIMLKRSNPYIFPYCNMMVLILGCNLRVTSLMEFLTDCCDVMNEAEADYRRTHGHLFRLLLAYYNSNEQDLHECRREFLTAIQTIDMLWGTQSPNYIVTTHYHAWLLLEQGQYNEAVYMLDQSLPLSEKYMGHRNLITISSLAVRARALSEMGHQADAIATLHDVLNRLELQINSHDYVSAENNLRDVLHFRVENFGITSDLTWVVIYKLRDLLVSQGRTDESSDFIQDYTTRFDVVQGEVELNQPWVQAPTETSLESFMVSKL